MKFDEAYNNVMKEILVEQPAPGAPVAPGPTPAPGAPPAPAAPPPPAPEAKKDFDKPYQDLARILYKALRMRFEQLPPEEQDRVLAIVPEGEASLDSDEKGVALFDVVDKLIKNQEVPQSTEEE